MLPCSIEFIGVWKVKVRLELWCVLARSSTAVRLAAGRAATFTTLISITPGPAWGKSGKFQNPPDEIKEKALECVSKHSASLCVCESQLVPKLQCAPLGGIKVMDARNVKRHRAAAVLTVSHHDAAVLLMGSRYTVQSWYWQQGAGVITGDIPPPHTPPPTLPPQTSGGLTSRKRWRVLISNSSYSLNNSDQCFSFHWCYLYCYWVYSTFLQK